MFEEDGNEPFTRNRNRLERLVSFRYYNRHDKADDIERNRNRDDVSSNRYTLLALYSIAVNYILGVGCLGMPYAFARSGLLLGIALIVGVSILSYATAMYVAEAEVRVRRLGKGYLLCKNKNQQHNVSDSTSNEHNNIDHDDDTKNVYMNAIATERTALVRHIKYGQGDADDSSNNITIEVSELVELLLGPFHGALYKISLLALMYIGLLAFTQVFRGSLKALLQSGNADEGNASFVSAFFFALVVVPLSCMELDEQVSVQTAMAMIRFLALFIMILGSIIALYTNPYGGGIDEDTISSSTSSAPQAPYLAPTVDGEMSYTVCFSGFGLAFSTALFSQLFQHSIPGLLKPLDVEKRGRVKLTLGAVLFTTSAFYLILGSSAALYFGSNLCSSVNLNFANFTFGLSDEESSASPLLLRICQVASNFVVLFPALDTLSIFPLIAITLGNNLASSFPQLHDFAKKYQIGNQNHLSVKIVTAFWRLVASIPPIIFSLWATDLSFSLQLAGIAGLEVAFFAPALLQRSSCAFITKRFGKNETETVYSGWHSNRGFVICVLVFATFSLCVVLVQIRGAWIDMRNRA